MILLDNQMYIIYTNPMSNLILQFWESDTLYMPLTNSNSNLITQNVHNYGEKNCR